MPLGYEGTWGNKDPDAKRWFELDWSDNLDVGITITLSLWSVVQGTCTIQGQEDGTTAGKVELAGGIDGETCLIKNSVNFSDGTNDDCTMRLDIRQT